MCPCAARPVPGVAPQPSEDGNSSRPTDALSSFLLVLALRMGTGHSPTQGHTVPPRQVRSTQSHPSTGLVPRGPGVAGGGGRCGWQRCQPAMPPRQGSAPAQSIHHLLKQSTHSAPPFVINYANQRTITLR